MSLGINLGDCQVRYFSADDEDNPVCDVLDIMDGCVFEVWTKDGVVHRNGAPAVTVREIETSRVVRQEYYENGKLHRLDGPAIEETRPDLDHHLAAYYVDGNNHCEDGPSSVYTSLRTGIVTEEIYTLNGEYHRAGGQPAAIERNADTGIVTNELYSEHGKVHRLDGPAEITRHSQTGMIVEERYLQNGEPYREGGPIVVNRDHQTGEVFNLQPGEPINRGPEAAFAPTSP